MSTSATGKSKSLILAMIVMWLLIARFANAAPQVIYIPADFPAICALELNSGTKMCPSGVSASSGDFCTGGLTKLISLSRVFGVIPCAGGSTDTDAATGSQAELVLLVDDRNLSTALLEALAPVVGTTENRSKVKAARRVFRNNPGTVVRDTIVIGERSGILESLALLQRGGDETDSGGATQAAQIQGCRSFGLEQICRQRATNNGQAERRMLEEFSDGVCLNPADGITCQSAGVVRLTINEPEGGFLMMDELSCEQSGGNITCNPAEDSNGRNDTDNDSDSSNDGGDDDSDDSDALTNRCPASDARRPEPLVWEAVIPDTLLRLEDLMAVAIEPYFGPDERNLDRQHALTASNTSLTSWWTVLEGLTGSFVIFDIEFIGKGNADQNSNCFRIESVEFTPRLQIDPDRAQIRQEWGIFSRLYLAELGNILSSCDRSGNLDRCVGEIVGFRDAVWHSIVATDAAGVGRIRSQVQARVSRRSLTRGILDGFDSGVNWWIADVPIATRDILERQLYNQFSLAYRSEMGQVTEEVSHSLHDHLITVLDGVAGGKIYKLLRCNTSADPKKGPILDKTCVDHILSANQRACARTNHIVTHLLDVNRLVKRYAPNAPRVWSVCPRTF